jgi:hypothetical protein
MHSPFTVKSPPFSPIWNDGAGTMNMPGFGDAEAEKRSGHESMVRVEVIS